MERRLGVVHTANGIGADAPASAGAPPLPCLRGNNSIQNPAFDGPKAPAVPVSKSAFKTEFCLKSNVELAAKTYGLARLAFFTVTFAKPVYSSKKAQEKINSLLSNVIRPRYGDAYLCIFERHESKAIHFHFIIRVASDIRTGFDWSAADAAYSAGKARNFPLARKLWSMAAASCDYLREEWAFWRGIGRRYRWLGRCELLPVRSTAEAIARYTGGYIGKHMKHRLPEDKGVRLVRAGKGMRWATSRLAFNTPRLRLWREKTKLFGLHHGCDTMEKLKKRFGTRWGYKCAPPIQAMPLVVDLPGFGPFDVSLLPSEEALAQYLAHPHLAASKYLPYRQC